MSAMLLRSFVISVVVAFSAVSSAEDESVPGGLFAWESVQLPRDKPSYVVVEEVDGSGRSSLTEVELPPVDDSEEQRRDEERRREQRNEFDAVYGGSRSEARDEYGCDDGSDRRKCLRMRRKWLRESYKVWQETMRRIMEDIDAKIRDLSVEMGKDSRASEFASVPSPGEGEE